MDNGKRKRIVFPSRSRELSFKIIRKDKKEGEDSIRVHWLLLQDPLSRFKAAKTLYKRIRPGMNESIDIGRSRNRSP